MSIVVHFFIVKWSCSQFFPSQEPQKLISSVMCKYKQCVHRLPADSLVFLGHCQLSLALTRDTAISCEAAGDILACSAGG